MKNTIKLLSTVLITIVPVATFAHSGHGVIPEGIGHYLTSPVHIFWSLFALGLIGLYAYRKKLKIN